MQIEQVDGPRALDELIAVGAHPELVRRRLDPLVEPYWSHARRAVFVLRDARRRAIGRIVAVANAIHDARFSDGRGFFGWLACPDDLAAAKLLVDAASGWLRERGYTHLRGPLHLGLGEEAGAILEGFAPRPGVLAPDNPPFLPVLLGGLGFSIVHERHGYTWSREEVPAPPASLRRNQSGDVVYRTLDAGSHGREAERFLAAYNAATAGRWGALPMTSDEARARVRDLLAFGDPRLIWLAEVRGEPAGVAAAVPVMADGASVPAEAPGRLAALRALRAMRTALAGQGVERVHVLTVAVDPRFRAMHVGAQLILRIWRSALDLGVREAELAGVDAGDEAMHTLLWRLGCRRLRRYGVYERATGA